MCAKVPRYIEIYSDLRLAILNNQYLPGSFLPTENELMEQFNASKTDYDPTRGPAPQGAGLGGCQTGIRNTDYCNGTEDCHREKI